MAESVIVIDLCRVAERGYIKSLIDAELRERLRAAISSDDAEMVCTWGRDCHRPRLSAHRQFGRSRYMQGVFGDLRAFRRADIPLISNGSYQPTTRHLRLGLRRVQSRS